MTRNEKHFPNAVVLKTELRAMKARRKYTFNYFAASVLMPCYLFIVVSHLFFLPRFQDNGTDRRSSYKINTQTEYLLVRNDRSFYSENKNVKTFPKTFVTVISGTVPANKPLAPGFVKEPFPPIAANRRDAWLVNCVFRI
jgi:hypothetical protein